MAVASSDGSQHPASLSKKGTPWTEQEHRAFLAGLQKYGKGQWKLISRELKTRTPTQIASHAQKHFLRVSGATRRKSRFSSIEAEMTGVDSEEPAVKRERLSGPSDSSCSLGTDDGAATTAVTAGACAGTGCAGTEGLSMATPYPGLHMACPMLPYPMMFGFPGTPPFLPPFVYGPPGMVPPAAPSAPGAACASSAPGASNQAGGNSGPGMAAVMPQLMPPMFPFTAMPFMMAHMAAMAAAAASMTVRCEVPASVCKPEALHLTADDEAAAALLQQLSSACISEQHCSDSAEPPGGGGAWHVSAHSAFRRTAPQLAASPHMQM